MTDRRCIACLAVILISGGIGSATPVSERDYGRRLAQSTDQVRLWWASSGWKISQDQPVPQQTGDAISVGAARNEAEAVQLVICPGQALSNATVRATDLIGPGQAVIARQQIDVLRVGYVHVTHPTDDSSTVGHWPDPLPPLHRGIRIEAKQNQPFWIRVTVPRTAQSGLHRGMLQIRADAYQADVPFAVQVFDFTLPDKMTCVTAFGFSPGNVFRYQNITDAAQKRTVLDKYWANFSAHHISPYDPAPLDHIGVQWPKIAPPPSIWDDWENLRLVDNESHTGQQAMLILDMNDQQNVTTSYKPLVAIPKQGLRVRFWYRTAVPGHEFNVAMNHYDQDRQWLSGRNNDLTFTGNGRWQEFDFTVTEFPAQARFIRLNARATRWTDAGEDMGLVWFDDLSLTHPVTGESYLPNGGFEPQPRTEPLLPKTKLKPRLDFSQWDRVMGRALDIYHFNSFRLDIPGIGGGTFHSRSVPNLLGFTEDMPEYPFLFTSYCKQIEHHLSQKGWLDEAFVYWFDEPLPKDYDYVTNGFAKLKQAAPDITRMLTVMKGVDEPLFGGPQIWCSISNKYDHEIAQQRRKHGEQFWWYICTGPKAPYCTLFIDHPGTELRTWLWQTWQRGIEGILVWQTNYWTSDTAYPDHPQNPYADPMGWRVGYGTPKGDKRPWGNGDGRFIYPPEAAADARPGHPVLEGPVDSIRWEMLRDGIEDYEYLALLKRLIQRHRKALTAEQIRRYRRLLEVPATISTDLTHFTQDPEPIERQRLKLARALEEFRHLTN